MIKHFVISIGVFKIMAIYFVAGCIHDIAPGKNSTMMII